MGIETLIEAYVNETFTDPEGLFGEIWDNVHATADHDLLLDLTYSSRTFHSKVLEELVEEHHVVFDLNQAALHGVLKILDKKHGPIDLKAAKKRWRLGSKATAKRDLAEVTGKSDREWLAEYDRLITATGRKMGRSEMAQMSIRPGIVSSYFDGGDPALIKKTEDYIRDWRKGAKWDPTS
jgi:hypothetical protein